jgi:serine/threonine protein kinase
MRIKNSARSARVVSQRFVEANSVNSSELTLVNLETAPVASPVVGSEVSPEANLAEDQKVNPEVNPEVNPGGSLTADPPENPGLQPEIKAVIKPESKSEIKPESKPEKFGAYELVWEIRRDALSITYAARNEGIEGLLALRVFSARTTEAAQVRSIQKAAKKASELTHLNLVAVYENGIGENGAPYLVTDLVEGETLAEVFQVSKCLDIVRFLDIFNQCCDALQEAHSNQLVHGNLSPNKIILQSNAIDHEVVKMIDFGMPPDPVQNAFYLSPEQRLDAQRIDAKTDIYALGCIMYEALVGKPPVVQKVTQTSLNYLHELANQYSPKSPEHNALKLLDCIIIKCLQHNPNKRFRSIRELMDALRLVNECISGGSSKRLPPKADRLLLFRFLDYFDKKIVAGMFAYILVAGVAFKFTGETQLQKYIDEAQFAKRQALPLAQEYWRAAIQQAESMGKPPSLIADLHWEFADTLSAQSVNEDGKSPNTSLCKDAIAEYKLAENYFSHGLRYRSYHLDLLKNISRLWMSMDNGSEKQEHRDKVLAEAKNLLAHKKYDQCAKLCSTFLKHAEDKQIAYCASSAYNELAITLPPEKALSDFARALYYVNKAEANNSAEQNNIKVCMAELKLDYELESDWLNSAQKALEKGDAEACIAMLSKVSDSVSYRARSAINDDHDLRCLAEKREDNDSNLKQAVTPLEQALVIEEQSYGLHSDALAPTLTALAYCYKSSGQDQKAIATYERLFSLSPKAAAAAASKTGLPFTPYIRNGDEGFKAEDILCYVDLLAKHGQNAKAIKLLEKSVLKDGKYDYDNPLFIRLIQAYVDSKDVHKARGMAAEALRIGYY